MGRFKIESIFSTMVSYTINSTNYKKIKRRTRKTLTYPYKKDTNLDDDIEVSKCIIIYNEETNDYHIVNIF
jgi:hypothetical protein